MMQMKDDSRGEQNLMKKMKEVSANREKNTLSAHFGTGDGDERYFDTLLNMSTTDSYLRGNVKPNVKRIDIYLNDQFVRSYPVRFDGSFIGYVSNNLKAGDIVKAIAVDEFNERREEQTIIIEAAMNLSVPTLEIYEEGERFLKGVAESASYIQIYLNGEHLRMSTVNPDGSFISNLCLDNTTSLKAGDVITIIPFDRNAVPGKAASTVVQKKGLD